MHDAPRAPSFNSLTSPCLDWLTTGLRSKPSRKDDTMASDPLAFDTASKSDTLLDNPSQEKGLGDESRAIPGKDATAEETEVAPVSLAQLFSSIIGSRTKFELFIDALVLSAPLQQGSAQPLMALLFGNLTNDFVKFGIISKQADSGNATATALLPEAAKAFKHTAALDASYLAYIGVSMFAVTYAYMYIWVYTGEVNAKRVGAGEVATRIQTDTHLVQQGISEKVAIIVTCFGSFFSGYILAYIRSWRLALALSAMLPAIAITGGVMAKFIGLYMQLSLDHIAESGNLAEEVISTIRTAQAFGTQKKLSAIYNGHIAQSKRLTLKAAIWNGGGSQSSFSSSTADMA
ncbi:hypothetical protein D9611_014797 [Ephemerocybe angulata]|uniref:ABC transmembrane type-1 domain-containing protein n=1 Tax=Ephemerocybe angulata TaxID=980116 RepID=A0A8H5FI31_9AGAR|nr:hypothetical protein D9611_014797 [Tulosesus angulatus]